MLKLFSLFLPLLKKQVISANLGLASEHLAKKISPMPVARAIVMGT